MAGTSAWKCITKDNVYSITAFYHQLVAYKAIRNGMKEREEDPAFMMHGLRLPGNKDVAFAVVHAHYGTWEKKDWEQYVLYLVADSKAHSRSARVTKEMLGQFETVLQIRSATSEEKACLLALIDAGQADVDFERGLDWKQYFS